MSVKPQIAQDGPEPLTIDELARAVGMTVRNLREWRALGLLPPPEMKGRVGYYDAAQVARIESIQQLRTAGFTLELIRRLLESSGDLADEALRFAGAMRAPFRDEHPPLVDLEALARDWGVTDPKMLLRATELGLIRERDDGQYEFTSARLARVGEALNRLGLSAGETLDATAEIRAHADGVADLFHRVWMQHVWQPFVDAGMPEERWPEIKATLDEVQPLALDAVVGLFGVAMDAKIEAGIAGEVERAGGDATQGGTAPHRR
ncbi:MAG: MerR family transcriptional regulator [Acidimicrobiales bacterium]|nr:MerR family transcriptional regulator [Acidimicrobiales bacterium]